MELLTPARACSRSPGPSYCLLGSVVFARWSGGASSGLRAMVTRNDRTIAMVLGFVLDAFFVLDGIRAL